MQNIECLLSILNSGNIVKARVVQTQAYQNSVDKYTAALDNTIENDTLSYYSLVGGRHLPKNFSFPPRLQELYKHLNSNGSIKDPLRVLKCLFLALKMSRLNLAYTRAAHSYYVYTCIFTHIV